MKTDTTDCQLTGWKDDLHRHPELAFEEFESKINQLLFVSAENTLGRVSISSLRPSPGRNR